MLARMGYNLCSLFKNAVIPLMLNPGAFGWGARAGLFLAAVRVFGVAWCYFQLPELKDGKYDELNVLFQHRVGARKFARTKADAFQSSSFAVGGVLSDESTQS